MTAARSASARATNLGRDSVALEVSALRIGRPDESVFVDFVLAARGQLEFDMASFSVRRIRTTRRPEVETRRRLLAPLFARVAALGVPIKASTVAPHAGIVHLAGGIHGLRAGAGTVITVHDPAPIDGTTADTGHVASQLRRAADAGAVLHAPTRRIADALVAAGGIDSHSVVMATPGIPPWTTAIASPGRLPQVRVLGTTDVAALVSTSLRDSGLVDVVQDGSPTGLDACVVAPTPGERFPSHLVFALAGGVPVVAARTWTTTAVLDGAARLVDGTVAQEFVDATVDLATSDSARSIAIAAGRARALDFSWERHVADFDELYRQALQGR